MKRLHYTSSETDELTTSYTYTDGTGGIPAGLLASQTDLLGRVTEMVYDIAGLLLSVTVAVGTADEATTEYDAHDDDRATLAEVDLRAEEDAQVDAVSAATCGE